MDSLRITLYQNDIVWEDKQKNLSKLHEALTKLRGATDILVLPEMFSTGFTLNAKELAEEKDGKTITQLQAWAAEFNIALIGSYVATENSKFYNRAFFISPDSTTTFYDKRHLFSMGNESEVYKSGNKQTVVEYKDWKINLLVCYDLRFPAWSRNINERYDLQIYVANWPNKRQTAWDTLLKARAIENLAYVCGVNRVGKDGYHLDYSGGSAIYSPIGETLIEANDNSEELITYTLSLSSLKKTRKHFPFLKDADSFQL